MPCQHGESVDTLMTAHKAIDNWVAEHSYLAEIARIQRSIEDALCSHKPADIPTPLWENYAGAFAEGIPLLRSNPLDKAVYVNAGRLLINLVEQMSETESPDKVNDACALLRDEFCQSPDTAARLVEQIASNRDEDLVLETQVNPGFARFICWRALETVLRPWIGNFAQWRADFMWGRQYCPFCGSHPAMAQLARTKKGRERMLTCGCCKSQWSYQRTRCPFCGNYDQDKLEILELEREEHFRIDACRDCNGYLKTYTGEGQEELLLADWSTLHLDILAGQEGLQRRADSLYEI